MFNIIDYPISNSPIILEQDNVVSSSGAQEYSHLPNRFRSRPSFEHTFNQLLSPTHSRVTDIGQASKNHAHSRIRSVNYHHYNQRKSVVFQEDHYEQRPIVEKQFEGTAQFFGNKFENQVNADIPLRMQNHVYVGAP